MAHTISILTQDGIKGSAQFEVSKNKTSESALRQALYIYEDRQHPGLAKVKSRGEVSLTTKKMYRQKHTGNARHGAQSAPIFVGGGVTHGPRGVKRVKALTDAMKQTAREAAILVKTASNSVYGVDTANISKTRDAAKALSFAGNKKTLVALSPDNWEKARMFRNIDLVTVVPFQSLSAYEIIQNSVLVIDSSLLLAKASKAKTEAKPKKAAKTTKTK